MDEDATPDGTADAPPTRPPNGSDPPSSGRSAAIELHDMIWPETGLATSARVPRRPKDELTERDTIELGIDFVTLSLSPLEFIQLASFLRMSIDGLLEQHPGLQRAVINAFDLRD